MSDEPHSKASRSQVPRGWLDPDGRDRSRTFTRRADAERHLAVVEGAKLSGTYVGDANPVTVAEYARQWVRRRSHRPTTATRAVSLISKYIDGTKISYMRLAAVRPQRCRPGSATDPKFSLRARCCFWCRFCGQCSQRPSKIGLCIQP